LKTILAALILGLGTGAWAQAAAISISGDHGDISAIVAESSGSARAEPAGRFLPWPVAGKSAPFDFQPCSPTKADATIVLGSAVRAEPVGSLSLTARTRGERPENGDATGDDGSDFLILGDYRPNFAFRFSYQLGVFRLPDNSLRGCVGDLRVSLTFTPVITIAREIPRGSCLEREMLAHENGHWAIDRKILPGLAPRLGDLAAAGVRHGFDGETVTALQSQVKAALRGSLDEFIDIFREARRAPQAAHDSPEERERVDRACGGAASEVAARVRGVRRPEPEP
jgi:hypothetical protein